MTIDLRNVKIFWDTPKLKGEKVMGFFQKNWSRLSLALLFFLGGILGIVAFVVSGVFNRIGTPALAWEEAFFYIALLMSVLVYFFGMTCVMVLKCVADKKSVSLAYMVLGAIIFVLQMVSLFINLTHSELISLSGDAAISSFMQFIVPTLLFGFYPLIKGITRFIEADLTPAPVKQAAAQAPAPAAKETPAAPAKPAAKTAAKPAAAKQPAKKTPAAK